MCNATRYIKFIALVTVLATGFSQKSVNNGNTNAEVLLKIAKIECSKEFYNL
jgi:hypothetical protein